MCVCVRARMCACVHVSVCVLWSCLSWFWSPLLKWFLQSANLVLANNCSFWNFRSLRLKKQLSWKAEMQEIQGGNRHTCVLEVYLQREEMKSWRVWENWQRGEVLLPGPCFYPGPFWQSPCGPNYIKFAFCPMWAIILGKQHEKALSDSWFNVLLCFRMLHEESWSS